MTMPMPVQCDHGDHLRINRAIDGEQLVFLACRGCGFLTIEGAFGIWVPPDREGLAERMEHLLNIVLEDRRRHREVMSSDWSDPRWTRLQ